MLRKIIRIFIFISLISYIYDMFYGHIGYIKKMMNLDVSKCNLIKREDTRLFFPDGELEYILDCRKDHNNIIEQLKDWKHLPVGEDINKKLSWKIKVDNIPKNGYYMLLDRSPSNFHLTNFIFVVYDQDTKVISFFQSDS